VEPSSDVIVAGPWFQFHHDEFTLPRGATQLAVNESGIQAFTMGRALAVQFHPEMTPDLLASWCDAGGAEELIDNGIDPDELIAETPAMMAESQAGLEQMLGWWLEELVG
jgi:GMP synthase-like glutamine amidotransferase